MKSDCTASAQNRMGEINAKLELVTVVAGTALASLFVALAALNLSLGNKNIDSPLEWH